MRPDLCCWSRTIQLTLEFGNPILYNIDLDSDPRVKQTVEILRHRNEGLPNPES